MLEKIIIENFKSFKEKTIISFEKTNYTILPQNVSESGVLKGSMFVGANASGKSNIILAIKLLLDFLFMDRSLNSGLFKCLFSRKSNYALSYTFLINGKHIVYSFEVDVKKGILKEKLKINEKILLERLGTSAVSYIADKNGTHYDENDIDKETLFLRTLFFNTKFTSNADLRELMAFLMNSVYINAFGNEITHYGKEKLSIHEYLKNKGTQQINDFFALYNFKQSVDFTHEGKGKHTTIIIGKDIESKEIFFKRSDIQEPIPFNEESLGNQNLLKMLPAFFEVLNKSGLLIIDEFSSGFHPVLEKMLVRYFMAKSKESQIIFVSHSTGLLSNTVMRPDQVYTVEFRGDEGSSVQRVSNSQPRTAQNIEKMYMSGVFGGLPDIKEFVSETE